MEETAAFEEKERTVTMRLKVSYSLIRNHFCGDAVRMDPVFLVGMWPWITLQDVFEMRHQLYFISNGLSDTLPLRGVQKLGRILHVNFEVMISLHCKGS